ncbi:AraC family transcriptional regulator [Prauserella halophila]|uniref:AraC family transcriptional regulator n=1 Tax=Prauserella halophila TaxID=185641 RepID=A0ABN1WJ57_9PSEU|nr:helix-turn-helix domain-containing protein [Prauserella halophila]MCP2238135.1 AraC-type DNA-binding protein [Prauserella halophila]
MVNEGFTAIEPVLYEPPSRGDPLEVLSLAELDRRMRRAGVGGRTERPGFHLIVHVQSGLLIHTVDFREYVVGDGAWLWVRPGQVQRFADLGEVAGAVVLFKQEFVDRPTATDIGLDNPHGRTLWSLAGDRAEGADLALRHLRHEYDLIPRTSSARHAILRHLLSALLLTFTDPQSLLGSPTEGHREPFTVFRDAVEARFAHHREVGYYAHTLGYSPRTLRRATLAAVGMGAKEFIDQRIILEAKRLLAHEDDSVAQIASRLGFHDASNFVKYFVQRAGHTPAAFRAAQRTGQAS